MERHPLKLLLVEGNPDDLFLFRETVAEINRDPEREYTIELTHASRLSDARLALEHGTLDAALLDLALEAIRMGVQDFLVKGRISGDLVVRSIRYAIERHRMTVMLRSAAFVDELTGLYNRRGFLRLAEHQIKLSHRKGRGYSLTFVDMDELKLINDRHGHQEGDEALRQAADVLRASFRESDVIGRIGGDEFVALAIETDAEDEDPIRERLRRGLLAQNERASKPYALSLSTGVLYQEHGSEVSLQELLTRADTLMYAQKRARREGTRPAP
jgi:two-component system cell cycle response regulator